MLLSYTCVFLYTANDEYNFGNNSWTRTWFELHADTRSCSHEPLFTDSEAAASPFFFVFCLICILPSPAVCVTTKMSNCNVGVCGLSTDQLDAGYMWWNFSTSLCFTSATPFLHRKREKEKYKNLYAWYVYIYGSVRGQTCLLNDKPHAPFPSIAPPCFKIFLSLVGIQ